MPSLSTAHPPAGLPARRRERRRAGRHVQRHESLGHALAAQPWITLVLLGALLLGGLSLLRPDWYAAQATLTVPSARAASDTAVRLSSPALVGEVEQAAELAPELRGRLRLEVAEDAAPTEVVVRASARDPRLAAVAADTAAALVVQEQGEGYALSAPATVPTEPERGRPLWWAWLAAPALAVATLVELRHRTWLRDHPGAVRRGVR